jgi:transposase
LPTDNEFTRILQWPGYRVYQQKIDEKNKTLDLWVRRKRGNRKLECSGCGRKFEQAHDSHERTVRDLPWSAFRTTVHIEIYRVKCPDCGIKVERVPLLPSKAPFSQRFEEAVGEACESASARQVARRFGLPESTVRAIDLRYLERWAARRRQPALKQMGVDEIYLGKKQKFITVVSNLDTREPVWFGRERKKETLDRFFTTQLSAGQRMRITAVCVDMWERYRRSIEEHAPNCRIVYDKFHVMQHASQAVDEVRRAEFFRQGGELRELVKGKRWLLLSRWINLSAGQRRQLEELFALNRKVFKAYLLKESLDRLWTYTYERAMLNYLESWIRQLRWQRLAPFEKLAAMLLDHLDGILNYCRTKVPLGVVEAINGNIKSLLRRGRGYKNLRYLLLKAQRMAATRTEFVVFRKAA